MILFLRLTGFVIWTPYCSYPVLYYDIPVLGQRVILLSVQDMKFIQ